jgi:hypothetical protein
VGQSAALLQSSFTLIGWCYSTVPLLLVHNPTCLSSLLGEIDLSVQISLVGYLFFDFLIRILTC